MREPLSLPGRVARKNRGGGVPSRTCVAQSRHAGETHARTGKEKGAGWMPGPLLFRVVGYGRVITVTSPPRSSMAS